MADLPALLPGGCCLVCRRWIILIIAQLADRWTTLLPSPLLTLLLLGPPASVYKSC